MFRFIVLSALLLASTFTHAGSIELSRVGTSAQSYCYSVFDSCKNSPAGVKLSLKSDISQLDLVPFLSYRQDLSITAVNGFSRSIMMYGPAIGHSIERISARRLTWGYEFAFPERAFTPTLGVGLSVLRMTTHDTMQYRPDINLRHSETTVRPYVALGAKGELTKNLDVVFRVAYANHRFGPDQLTSKFGKTSEFGLQFNY